MCISGVQSITQNKIKQNSDQTLSNKMFDTVWPLNDIKHSFLGSLMSERNQNKPNYIEKKSNVKTESNPTSAKFRRNNIIMLRFRKIKEERIIIEMIPQMISTCRFRAFFPW